MSATSILTKNLAEVSFQDLSPEVVEATRKQILDTMGVIVAGSTSDSVKELADLVKDWSGKQESTILGFGGKVPSPNAALVNGFSAVVLDYDDFHDLDFAHVSRAIVPASIAMAEHKGAVNGKDFIAAVALGFDLASRLSRASIVHLEFGFDLSIPNFFGAAAAAGKLLGLNEEKLRHTLGIALMQMSGAGAGIREGTKTKGLGGGLEAKGGVIAALMAERGFTAASDPIEANRGYYHAFHRGLYRPALLTADLGKVFEGATNSQKPYPSCRWTHCSIDATLALVNEYDIRPEDVEGVTVNVGPYTQFTCEPRDIRQSPPTSIQSQFSIPWAVANAILYRKVGIEHFTEKAIRDTKTLEMARKVATKMAPTLANIRPAGPAIVEIKTKRRRVYSRRVDFALGSPENPMSFDELSKKFRDCCNYKNTC